MGATWILSANASRARFFSQANPKDSLVEVHSMVNDAARLRSVETSESDKRGPHAATKSIHNVGGETPNKLYEPPQSPEKHEAELFARDIAKYLLQNYQDGSFQQLSLVVSPQFLGMLRTLLDHRVASAVKLEVNKDYTQSSAEQLLEQLETLQAKG